MALPVPPAVLRSLSPSARDYLGRGGSPRRRPAPLDPARPAVVRVDRGTRTLRVTLPRHLARALDYRWRDYLHFALTDDGRGLVIRHFARL